MASSSASANARNPMLAALEADREVRLEADASVGTVLLVQELGAASSSETAPHFYRVQPGSTVNVFTESSDQGSSSSTIKTDVALVTSIKANHKKPEKSSVKVVWMYKYADLPAAVKRSPNNPGTIETAFKLGDQLMQETVRERLLSNHADSVAAEAIIGTVVVNFVPSGAAIASTLRRADLPGRPLVPGYVCARFYDVHRQKLYFLEEADLFAPDIVLGANMTVEQCIEETRERQSALKT